MCEFMSKGNQLEIRSSLLAKQEKVLVFSAKIRDVCVSSDFCGILLESGSVFIYDLVESSLREIPLTHPDQTVKLLSCTNQLLFGITDVNSLILLNPGTQTKLHEFPRHMRVKKMVSGAEHSLLLTHNGDVFSFGCGLRGALGHGDVNSHEVPKQVDGLAGLKIVDIDAGSFHSAAVSSFGDAYCWGWNTAGQLGLPKVAQGTFDKSSGSSQQVFTLPMVIELEDEEVIEAVRCGSKHTILVSERKRLFTAGLNSYGQLGLSKDVEFVDKFTEIPVKNVNDKTRVSCGALSTFLINL